MKSWLEDDPNFIIDENNGKYIYCQKSNKNVSCDRKSQLVQYENTSLHKRKSDETDTTLKAENVEQVTSSKKINFMRI